MSSSLDEACQTTPRSRPGQTKKRPSLSSTEAVVVARMGELEEDAVGVTVLRHVG